MTNQDNTTQQEDEYQSGQEFDMDMFDIKPIDQPPIPRDSLIVVESVIHRQFNQNPTTISQSRYARDLSDTEQAYIRRTKVGSEWTKLDTGYVNIPAIVCLSNLEGTGFQVIPDQSTKDDIAKRDIQLGMLFPSSPTPQAFAIVRPGESLRFEPATDTGILWIRSCHLEARYVLSVVEA